MSAPHLTTLRVYYEDTDFSGFVYHAGYLRFMERGRTEYLRTLGITQSTLHRDTGGLVFVVSSLTLNYLKPALMDDVLTVTTEITELRGASMRMNQTVSRDATVLVRAEITVAAVREGRAVRLPDRLKAALSAGLRPTPAAEPSGDGG